MSPTPLDLPVLLSQTPYVARVAHVENAKPEIQKQLFGPLINEHIRQNETKVQEVEKKEKTDPVDRDGPHQEQQAQHERQRHEKEEEAQPETNPSSASPWSGNIVNVKI
ncbi:hypothetical protein [Pseudodesulfovibrio sp.]|uniref:hypothetical protein n=1 Tax=Pseudodesulfovibrio sp. TaxID=2035812 RepID=UPI00261D9B5E|nr:hypothetical protein [Pseudodesulfovibrio sp.]MDD3310662.1 hypothetical protein [Pseudodesulfovibrio sp.]